MAVVGFAIMGGSAPTAPTAPTAPQLATRPSEGLVRAAASAAIEPSAAALHFVVHGRVTRDARYLRLRLEDASGGRIAIAALDPTGHGRHGWVPFVSSFLVAPGAVERGTPLFVVVESGSVNGLGGQGVKGVQARHPLVGGLFLSVTTAVDPAAGAGADAAGRGGPHGAGGLIGGIVFGVPMAERGGP